MDTASRKQPKAISSRRFDSAWAKRAPYGAVKLETGAIRTKPISDTNPSESGGLGDCGGRPGRVYASTPRAVMGTPRSAGVGSAGWIGQPERRRQELDAAHTPLPTNHAAHPT